MKMEAGVGNRHTVYAWCVYSVHIMCTVDFSSACLNIPLEAYGLCVPIGVAYFLLHAQTKRFRMFERS